MKKEWLSRTVATLLAGVMTAGMLTGCGEKQAAASETETTTPTETVSTETETAEVPEELTYPVDTDEKLSFYIVNTSLLARSSAYTEYNDVPFYKGLSEKTGISVDWSCAAQGANNTAAYNLLLQEEKLPSILFGNICSIDNVTELYTDGLIYDLTEYLPVYAPDFWEYINLPENAANKKAITNEDGQFLFFPAIQESDFCITYLGPVIRQDWLDELNLKTPVTLEDWENVLIAFRDNYGAYFTFTLDRFNNAGIAGGTGAFAPFKLNFFVEDGQIKCANTQDEWKEFLTVMNRWYDEGLIDPDFTSIDDATIRSKALSGEVGIAYTAMSQLTNYVADAEAEGTGAEWVGFSYPRAAEGVATTYIQTRSQTYNPNNGAVITTSCSEEELIAACKFLNYGYTEEGAMYWNMGEEGVSYEVDADGEAKYTELVTADERGIAESLKDYTGMYGAGIGIQLETMLKAKNNEASVEAVYEWTDNTEAAGYIVPNIARTAEEQTEYSDINSQVSTYVSEMALKFVTGVESLDNFDKFVETLESMGLQTMLDINQSAYERYIAK